MQIHKYDKYKASEIPWLGNVPDCWEIRRLKFSVDLINEKNKAIDTDLEYMGLEHIESWTGNRIEDELSQSDGIGAKFIDGDVLFGKLRPYLAKVYLADREGLATTEALILRAFKGLDSKYLKYYLLSKDFINIVDSSTYGAKMPRANWEFIGNLPFLLPDAKEQQKIAAFLDYKTQQIDQLIEKKKALIEKLNEQRIAIITQAVTKGLNKNAKMKPSGVDWLGDVPVHWETRRLKFLTNESLQYGANEAAVLDDKDLPRFIRITDVKDDGTLHDDTFRSLPENVAEPFLLDEGDILLARSGATVGKSFKYSKSWGKAAYAGYLIKFSVDRNIINEEYAYLYFQSSVYWDNINSTLIQATIENFSAEKYANIELPLPDLKEQEVIVSFLSERVNTLDKMRELAQRVIEKLEEYRSSLITDAVTGKIDVHNIEIPGAEDAA